jgi:molybdopterin converting factor small subunit
MSNKGKATVTVALLGVATVTVELEEGATLQDALTGAEKVLGVGEKSYINGVEADLDAPVKDGDVASVVPPVKGGC